MTPSSHLEAERVDDVAAQSVLRRRRRGGGRSAYTVWLVAGSFVVLVDDGGDPVAAGTPGLRTAGSRLPAAALGIVIAAVIGARRRRARAVGQPGPGRRWCGLGEAAARPRAARAVDRSRSGSRWWRRSPRMTSSSFKEAALLACLNIQDKGLSRRLGLVTSRRCRDAEIAGQLEGAGRRVRPELSEPGDGGSSST